MSADKHHLQLRLSSEIKGELENLAERYELSTADIVRGTLFFGIPVFSALSELQGELVRRLVSKLKKESRLE